MSANRQPKWKLHNLPIEDIRERKEHQVRAAGVSLPHVNSLSRVMEAEGDLGPISVAKIGKAHCVVDGFHRLAAARKLGWSVIAANVATMSAGEARDFALLSNTRHGKRLSREDKRRLFERYLEGGKHLDADGAVKASRAIQVEVNHIYSHETIRTKLKERGIEVDLQVEYPLGYKRRGSYEGEEDDLTLELAEDAQGHLEAFGSLFFDLEKASQEGLLRAARELLGRLERGKRRELTGDHDAAGLLDI